MVARVNAMSTSQSPQPYTTTPQLPSRHPSRKYERHEIAHRRNGFLLPPTYEGVFRIPEHEEADLIPPPLFSNSNSNSSSTNYDYYDITSNRKIKHPKPLYVALHNLHAPANPPSAPLSTTSSSSLSPPPSPLLQQPHTLPTLPSRISTSSPSFLPPSLSGSSTSRSKGEGGDPIRVATPQFAVPRCRLRRRASPRAETLRALRIKESEACLRRAYDERLRAYLCGGWGG